MFRKGKNAVKGDSKKKVRVGLKRRWELSKRRLAWWGFTEKKASHLLGVKRKHQSFSCGLHRCGGGGPNGQIVNVKRTADGKMQRSREIIGQTREKYRAKSKTPRKERLLSF